MDNYRPASLLLFSLGAIQVLMMMIGEASCGFSPPGKFDLGPADLSAMCPMIKNFGDTGEIPEPTNIDPNAEPDGECVFFEWVPCQDRGHPSKPCGWYEMRKCDEAGRRKRAAEVEEPMKAGPEVLPYIGFAYETLNH